jgi:hypothetical protein
MTNEVDLARLLILDYLFFDLIVNGLRKYVLPLPYS